MVRKIIYAVLGGPLGFVVGLFVLALVADNLNGTLAVSLACIVGIVGVILGFRIAERLNRKEAAVSAARSESSKGIFYIALSILGVQAIASLILILIVLVAFGFNLAALTTFLNTNQLFIFVIALIVGFFWSWLGVKYVSWKKFLKPFHTPSKIVWTVIAIDFVLSIQQLIQSPLAGIVGLIVAFISLNYFLNAEIKKLSSMKMA